MKKIIDCINEGNTEWYEVHIEDACSAYIYVQAASKEEAENKVLNSVDKVNSMIYKDPQDGSFHFDATAEKVSKPGKRILK